ncbi:flagellar assembly factor FliW [Pseudobutyrivibrio sp. C4]|jgi:flagellar assembly factor FliW|uniref:flagellar assembly protein FliW n=1 Tax=Pseudobutyrivibrio sp. C4 TaxID=1520803 RepID=UPI0008C03B9E|nr:flagellar assembly protein FliW [Pseudobutyrivibrio sp. C4]SET39448.1 flagellar assembly factor FliW [Pseudobutyrivibrio sp. C4]
MQVKTRLFGEIEIAEEKIINLIHGLIGFPDMKRYTLIFDEEKKDKGNIMWLQSLDETDFAMPVMLPHVVKPDYAPELNVGALEQLGELTADNTYMLVTVRVPKNPKEASINLKAPIIINTDTNIGDQIIIEGNEPVRYLIHDAIHGKDGE